MKWILMSATNKIFGSRRSKLTQNYDDQQHTLIQHSGSLERQQSTCIKIISTR
uniref:Uncharacterized protein n=1 Tax=Anguilla anguilla TaxID=7936 RepID=A0A0E9R9K8_ANGAN